MEKERERERVRERKRDKGKDAKDEREGETPWERTVVSHPGRRQVRERGRRER